MRRNRLLHASSFRLGLLYAGLLTASVLVLFGVTYWFATDYAARDETDEIGVEFASIQDEVRSSGEARLPTIIDNHVRLRKDVRAVYLLQDPSGHKIAGNIEAMTPFLGPKILDRIFDGEKRQVRAYGYNLSNGDYLLVGQDTATLRQMKALIFRSFGIGFIVTVLLAILGSVIVSSTVLKRVETVGRTARAIIGGDFSQRVPVRGTDDEFDELAASMNAMLDRIEDLMRSMRQVSNDIAHDLRTPLTRLRQRLEHARRRTHTVEELQEALGHSIAQVDSILETFGALLRIAQIEADTRSAREVSVDVSKLLSGIVDDFAPAAEDHGQQLVAEIESRLSAKADPELLTQMVVNLVENAIRYSPVGARIAVQARASAGYLELAVSDTGPGIPMQERENVLRPFYRLEASRTTEGSGLGLSLVAAIAKRHQAKLSLNDNDPGLRVVVLFPVAA
ncbi:MAG TPA: HAMP domain-containing sensor histidine kinase [Micropepsaceae bacterium]